MESKAQYVNMLHLRRLMATNEDGSNVTKGDDNSLILLDTYTKFGRSESNDVQLTSCHGTKPVNSTTNMISREHAYISGTKTASGRIEKYMLTDQSLNGTYINDYRCRANYQNEIHEGDIIKFGHMNGASIKEGTPAPQANAEFAFLVERAKPDCNYLGFSNGVRTNSLLCTGDDINAKELTRKSSNVVNHAPAAHPPNPYLPHSVGVQLPTTTTGCNTATTANMMSLFNFPLFNIYQPPYMQPLAGFRPPNVGSPYGQPLSFGQPLQPNLLQRNIFDAQVSQHQQQQFFNQLLTSSAGPIGIQASEALVASAAASSALINAARVAEEAQMVQPAHQEAQQKTPQISEKTPVQMECDSSVPSPPKVVTTSTTPITPQLASPNVKSEASDIHDYKMESPTIRRTTVVAANPWDSTPSPKQRDTPDTGSLKDHDDKSETNRDETDTESRPEEVRKQPATSTSSSKGDKGKKNNECARLLAYSTAVLPSFKGRRTSSSRRLTDEERYERNALKEHRRKEKAAASSSKDSKSRLKQLSSEDSLSSDDDSDDVPTAPPPKKEAVKRKRTPPSESDEEDIESDDSSKKKKKNKKTKPRKSSITPKQMTPKMKWKKEAKKARDESEESAEDDVEPVKTQIIVGGKEEPCKMRKCVLGGTVLTEDAQWVQCDDCDEWFHNTCALGHNKPFTGDKFFCGCQRAAYERTELETRKTHKTTKTPGRKAKK